jgi:hypothetical protein
VRVNVGDEPEVTVIPGSEGQRQNVERYRGDSLESVIFTDMEW